MYLCHKFIIVIVFIIMMCVSYIFNLNFKLIASDGITIISIILAIYAISLGSLIESSLSEDLSKEVDSRIKTKTKLGVLKTYINNAIALGLITLILSCAIKLLPNSDFCINFKNFIKINIFNLISSICFSFLSLNFVYVWLVIKFILCRQIWAKNKKTN